MNSPKMNWEMNINTWLQVVGFAFIIGGGYSAYQSFKTETEAWREETSRQVEKMELQQAKDVARVDARSQLLENTVQGLLLRDARTDERMNNMIKLLENIDAQLKREGITK